MSNPAETLSQMIEALAEESSKARRRTHANTAYAALLQLRETRPPADSEEAERRGHEAGFLAAMELLRETQRDLADPIKKASYADELRQAAGAMDSLLHYADTVVTQFEIRATRALRPQKKAAT